MYLEYGVTSRNCSDHDHQAGIVEVNGIEAVRFTHDIWWSGSIWLQYVSQCENDFDSDPTGIGVYYKGTQWYPSFGYPTSPSRDIIIDVATLTNCQFPFFVTSGATEYGCGPGDAT